MAWHGMPAGTLELRTLEWLCYAAMITNLHETGSVNALSWRWGGALVSLFFQIHMKLTVERGGREGEACFKGHSHW